MSPDLGRGMRFAVTALAVAAPLATRLPADGLTTLGVAFALAGIATAAAVLMVLRRPRWATAAFVGASGGLLLVPVAHDASLPLHPAIPAVAMLGGWVAAAGQGSRPAPRLGAATRWQEHRRALAWPGMLLAAMVVLPAAAAAALPDRLASLHELQAPTGILLMAGVLVALLAGAWLVRRLWTAREAPAS